MRIPVAFIVPLFVILPAFAGEPLATEDASVLPRGTCQLESLYRYQRGERTLFLLPACSPIENLELATGGAYYRTDEDGSHAVLQLQAKSVLYTDPGERWSAGAVFVVGRDTGRASEDRTFQEAAALAIASFNFLDETLRVHLNGGVVYSHDEYTTGAWGAAVEYDAAERWTLLGEVYRDGPGRPRYQLGVRYTVVPDRFELYVSAGDRFHSATDTWLVKAGVRLQTPELW